MFERMPDEFGMVADFPITFPKPQQAAEAALAGMTEGYQLEAKSKATEKEKREAANAAIREPAKGVGKTAGGLSEEEIAQMIQEAKDYRPAHNKKYKSPGPKNRNCFWYSEVVPKSKIRENDYNLNIPRYVDSSDPAESWDLYSSMFGGMPLTPSLCQ